LVLGETAEDPGKTLSDLVGNRNALTVELLIDGKEFTHLIGALHYGFDGVGDEGSAGALAALGQCGYEEKGHVPQVVFSASLNGKGCHLRRGDLINELEDTVGDILTTLVEGIFPQEAAEDRSAEFPRRVVGIGFGSLVCQCGGTGNGRLAIKLGHSMFL